jgi:hypothetical protein
MKKINLNLKMPMLKVIVIIVNFIGDRAEQLGNFGDKSYITKFDSLAKSELKSLTALLSI